MVWVSDVELRDFRNHEHTTLTFQPGVTVLTGANGQGKTNLVEAIGYLSHLTSHRVSADKALVRDGVDHAIVRARVTHEHRSVDLACEIRSSGSNRAKLNGQQVTLGELAGWLKVVLFTPEDLSIVRGDPSIRRRYLDQAVSTLVPRMHTVFAEYDRVVKQRNTLLKVARGQTSSSLTDSLASWDEALVTLASDITAERRRVIHHLQPHAEASYQTLASGDTLTLELDSPLSTVADDQLPAAYRSELERRRREEMDRSMTLVGPHRDDLAIVLNGLPGRTHSSHGEAWSLALSLRMALAKAYREESLSGDPVIILDDVFAELDQRRRRALQELVTSFEQVLVTAAVREDIPTEFASTTFTVTAGEVTPD